VPERLTFELELWRGREQRVTKTGGPISPTTGSLGAAFLEHRRHRPQVRVRDRCVVEIELAADSTHQSATITT